ncbi:MAG: glycoside hydrolase family 57 protein [Pseudomonadota bacterium]
MKPVTLALLWHMHQPSYRLRNQESTFLPWVRLHAIRSYYDMVELLTEFPQVRVTINLVPVLIEQLRAYQRGASDFFWDMARIPADDLGENERKFLFENFFSAQTETMIGPFPRYAELHKRRTRIRWEAGPENAWQKFTTDDYRDLKLLFDLCWFGFKAREDFPQLRELTQKGYGFTENDLQTVHSVEREILERLLTLYQETARRGQLEISCSPYSHPILPLLVNTESAREAMPTAELPPPFAYPEDARQQILDGLAYVEQELGIRPQGMWPSEGSVSDAVLKIFNECGLKWAASDESVLRRSKLEGEPNPHHTWVSESFPEGTALVFRDRDLSDRVGFNYAKMDPKSAVQELLREAEARGQASQDGCLILLALDGENPWEHYPRAGADFLRTLYGALSDNRSVRTLTVGEAVAGCTTRKKIRHLHAGSWINSDFGIWIGGPEKNRTWSVLGRVRSELSTPLTSAELLPEERKAAWASLRAAEGSDWFWWLDNQFDNMYIPQFDETLRGHLKEAYQALHLIPPHDLDFPIAGSDRRSASRLRVIPFSKISPKIDGYEADFFEWLGAVRIPWKSLWGTSTMLHSQAPVQSVHFGFSDQGVFFFRIDPVANGGPDPFSNFELKVTVKTADTRELTLRLDAEGKIANVEGFNRFAPVLAVRKIFEFSIPYVEFGMQPGGSASFIIEIRTPKGSGVSRTIELHVPAFSGRYVKKESE